MRKVVRVIFMKKKKHLLSKFEDVWDELLWPKKMFNALKKLDIFS